MQNETWKGYRGDLALCITLIRVLGMIHRLLLQLLDSPLECRSDRLVPPLFGVIGEVSDWQVGESMLCLFHHHCLGINAFSLEMLDKPIRMFDWDERVLDCAKDSGRWKPWRDGTQDRGFRWIWLIMSDDNRVEGLALKCLRN